MSWLAAAPACVPVVENPVKFFTAKLPLRSNAMALSLLTLTLPPAPCELTKLLKPQTPSNFRFLTGSTRYSVSFGPPKVRGPVTESCVVLPSFQRMAI